MLFLQQVCGLLLLLLSSSSSLSSSLLFVVVAVVIINRSVKYSITVSCTQFSLLHIVHFAYEI